MMVSFTLQERRALLLLFSLAGFYLLMDVLPSKQAKTYSVCLDDMVSFQERVEKSPRKFDDSYSKDYQKFAKAKTKSKTSKEKKVFQFNPNTIGLDSLQQLGFDKKVSERWIKFREKGKVYTSMEDLKSIYGVDENILSDLKDYASFPAIKNAESSSKERVDFETKKHFYDEPKLVPQTIIDLNTCEAEDLKALGGIGKVFASRILKYREILGGYASKDQLLDVYGLTDSTYQLIKDHVMVDTPPNRIKINTQSLKELSANYLIRHKAAKIIYAYRSEHGPFVNVEDFQKVKGLKKDFKEQIIPYLDFAL